MFSIRLFLHFAVYTSKLKHCLFMNTSDQLYWNFSRKIDFFSSIAFYQIDFLVYIFCFLLHCLRCVNRSREHSLRNENFWCIATYAHVVQFKKNEKYEEFLHNFSEAFFQIRKQQTVKFIAHKDSINEIFFN